MTLPFGLSPEAAAFMAAVIFVAAFVRGYSGFGYPVLVIAAGALVMNPLVLLPVALIGDLLLCIQHWRAARPHVHWPTVRRLVIGAAIGMVPALWALGRVDEQTARVVIGIAVMLAGLVMLSGWTLPGRVGPSATLGMGIVSGLVSPAGVAGPPVVALAAALGLAPLAFRATLLGYFIALDIMTFGQFWLAGRVAWDVLWAALLSAPLVVVGSWWGARGVHRANPLTFRRITIGVMIAMAALGLGRALL
ncbi:MAG: sulfite exporter TauE/SafE family protein [Rhodobacter sp.]|uniref:sulfite exporter TauE/SafE family protein n=1 Tax=Pararhodobacter sp. TaxID=2127056 RepID=UPI001DF02A11|nr:sulfite exporter TauE/SafE family protein [Pararhodobacter sp.]MCB1345892.1 sulfite exporter TauE/SafE family protein [Paracoccaceae bacterium]MCC0072775.1 sulfite exporter TauE/SafE family protein [Rhodobacter sp.]HPD92085.1 sulfite exporter TauE/SafE family protein [Pararhodobacter sp.]